MTTYELRDILCAHAVMHSPMNHIKGLGTSVAFSQSPSYLKGQLYVVAEKGECSAVHTEPSGTFADA